LFFTSKKERNKNIFPKNGGDHGFVVSGSSGGGEHAGVRGLYHGVGGCRAGVAGLMGAIKAPNCTVIAPLSDRLFGEKI
jgi:hypothetical protein